MQIDEFKRATIITADLDKYLVLKDNDKSEEIIGKPVRMIFNKEGKIPELEEKELEIK